MFRSSILLFFLGGLCYYAALPPLNIAPLALAVPIFWGMAIRQPIKWYYVYFTALLFWLTSIWWIACPHPLTAVGLFALSAYLSLYWLLFFVSARVAVHRYNVPLLIAMPICWIGTEYLRCRILGGFSFCALEHAFYLYPPLIQLASIGGSMLVGGAIMFFGAALCEIFVFVVSSVTKMINHKGHEEHKKGGFLASVATSSVCAVLLHVLLVLFVVDYSNNKGTHYSIVALQGNRQVYLNADPKEAEKTFLQFVNLTYQEIHERRQSGTPLPDVIVFPETICHIPVVTFEGAVIPADLDWTEEDATYWETEFREFAQRIETPIILGLSTYAFGDDSNKPKRLNSALYVRPSLPPDSSLLTPDSSSMYRYDKMHLVMFGEYIPFAEYLPDDFILRTLCPEAHHSDKPVAFPIRARSVSKEQQIYAAVNICFESSVAHLIRRQVLTLRREGRDPRMLINLSNDGWFRFSHQMEQHLATHVFRAVENRMSYVTAANGGFSAIISPLGVIQQMGERGAAEAVSGTVSINLEEAHTLTIYQKYGDWYALPFAVGVLILAGIGFWERRR